MLLAIDAQTSPVGICPIIGHDNSATQIGKVLVIVNMSVSGR